MHPGRSTSSTFGQVRHLAGIPRSAHTATVQGGCVHGAIWKDDHRIMADNSALTFAGHGRRPDAVCEHHSWQADPERSASHALADREGRTVRSGATGFLRPAAALQGLGWSSQQ